MFESAAVHPSLPVTVELKETPIRNATTDQRKKKKDHLGAQKKIMRHYCGAKGNSCWWNKTTKND
jgi:hypothetical protein